MMRSINASHDSGTEFGTEGPSSLRPVPASRGRRHVSEAMSPPKAPWQSRAGPSTWNGAARPHEKADGPIGERRGVFLRTPKLTWPRNRADPIDRTAAKVEDQPPARPVDSVHSWLESRGSSSCLARKCHVPNWFFSMICCSSSSRVCHVVHGCGASLSDALGTRTVLKGAPVGPAIFQPPNRTEGLYHECPSSGIDFPLKINNSRYLDTQIPSKTTKTSN